MTASTVWINGVRLGEYKGGYTPFSFELTPHIDFDGENVLAVDVDSTERPDIPPFGYQIDYLTFGGIYREVSLRIVPPTFIENIFAKPKDVLTAHPSLDVDCYPSDLWRRRKEPLTLEVELREGDRVLAKGTQRIPLSGWRTNRSRTLSTSTILAPSSCGISRTPICTQCRFACARDADGWIEVFADHRFSRSAIHRSRLRAQRQGHQAARTRPPSDISLRRPGDARPRAAPRRRDSAQQAQDATSSAPRTIRSRATFSTPATRLACWCWKRFPAGSTSATKPGS